MRYVTRAPRPALASSIGMLWFVSDVPANPRERVIPSGTLQHLLVHPIHHRTLSLLLPWTA